MACDEYMTDVSRASGLAPMTTDLLLRETHHRCSNDLQLVVSLLALQSRRATSDETREALTVRGHASGDAD